MWPVLQRAMATAGPAFYSDGRQHISSSSVTWNTSCRSSPWIPVALSGLHHGGAHAESGLRR